MSDESDMTIPQGVPSRASSSFMSAGVPPPPKGKARFFEASSGSSGSGLGFGPAPVGGVEPEPSTSSVKRRVVKIKPRDDDLVFTGTNVKKFLTRFELAAEVDGAEGYDMVRQIIGFVKGEDLKLDLEDMEGYSERDWELLKNSMIERWSDALPVVRHTLEDLDKLAEIQVKRGGLKTYSEYRKYLSEFLVVLKYLVYNEHLNHEYDSVHIFFKAFSQESQKNMKRELLKEKKVPIGRDGYYKTPSLKVLREAAEIEMQLGMEMNLGGSVRVFRESNQVMQKKLDEQKGASDKGKKREKMVEDNPAGALESKVEKLGQELATLVHKIQSGSVLPASQNPVQRPPQQTYQSAASTTQPHPANEYGRGENSQGRKLFNDKPIPICYYCGVEGHTSQKCRKIEEDISNGLVRREGSKLILPSGAQVWWDKSRPTRQVVIEESERRLKQGVTSAAVRVENNCQHYQGNCIPAPTPQAQPVSILKKPDQEPSSSGPASKGLTSAVGILEWTPPEARSESFVGNFHYDINGVKRGRPAASISEKESAGKKKRVEFAQEPSTREGEEAMRMIEEEIRRGRASVASEGDIGMELDQQGGEQFRSSESAGENFPQAGSSAPTYGSGGSSGGNMGEGGSGSKSKPQYERASARDYPDAVKDLTKEIFNARITTTVGQLTAVSPALAEEIKRNVSKRRIQQDSRSSVTHIITQNKEDVEPMDVKATMMLREVKSLNDETCYYSCALGFVEAGIKEEVVEVLVDSGSMVNVMPEEMAIKLGLEVVGVKIKMRGVSGDRCDIVGVVEFCPLEVGSFTGPVHFFVAKKINMVILGRPFLFDYKCQLNFTETGELLTFQGEEGRRVQVTLARQGQGSGWDNRKSLSSDHLKVGNIKIEGQDQVKEDLKRLYGKKYKEDNFKNHFL